MKTRSVELEIPLSPTQKVAVRKWLDSFIANEPNWAEPPVLKRRNIECERSLLSFFPRLCESSRFE